MISRLTVKSDWRLFLVIKILHSLFRWKYIKYLPTMLFYVCFVLYICSSLCCSLSLCLSLCPVFFSSFTHPVFSRMVPPFVDWAVKRISKDISRLWFCHSKGKSIQTMLYLWPTVVYWLPFAQINRLLLFHTHVSSQPWGCCLFLLLGELEIETPHSGALAPLFMVHNNVQAFSRLCNHHKHPVPRSNRCIFANASTWCQSQTFLPVNKCCAQACIYFNKLARES